MPESSRLSFLPRFLRLVLTALGAVLLWVPLACLLWPYRPYLADLLAMTAGYAVALYLLPMLLACIWRRWRTAGYILLVVVVSGVVVAYQNLPIANPGVVPFTAAQAAGTQPAEAFVIVSFNAHGDPTVDQNAFADWVLSRGAQVVVVISAPDDETVLSRRLVEEQGYHRASRFGQSVYVLGRVDVRLFTGPDRPGEISPPLRVASFEAQLYGGQTLRLLPERFPSPRSALLWENSLGLALAYGRWAAWVDEHAAPPVIAPHDDNSTPAGRLYQVFAGASGFCDAQTSFLPHGTWPAYLPPWASLSIDHIWLSRKLLLEGSGVGPPVGTLHRPVWAAVRVQR